MASPPAYTADLSALPAALDGAKRLTEVLQVICCTSSLFSYAPSACRESDGFFMYEATERVFRGVFCDE